MDSIETSVVVDVDSPRVRIVSLDVVDELGQPLSWLRARACTEGDWTGLVRSVEPREPKRSFLHCGQRFDPLSSVRSLPSGLPVILALREHGVGPSESTAVVLGEKGSCLTFFRLEGWSRVADPTPTDAVEQRWIGVSLPDGFFDDSALLPDGTRAVDVGAELAVYCDARPAHEGAWRDVLVHVSVSAPSAEYRSLAFEYRLSQGAPSLRVMETKESPRTSEEHRLPAWARVPSSLQREKIIREILAICGSGEIEVWKAKLTD